MPVSYDQRGWSSGSAHTGQGLGDKYEVVKEIGDGSFGSVALARVRAGGAHIAKRNTMVAIKTMKKSFDSLTPCLELREIIFLQKLPEHRHLVPALDIFLDPMTKKLHIAMEYMDGNLYQLMKARDHKPFDGSSVKSILFQIMSGLEHIHDNDFFHRDIKPENILVTVSSQETGNAFKRYSSMVTPPSTPPSYTVKIADFGLARETRSKLPYTTYVSTRWYRAPEVLLRAGEYSAPVDIWAIGAMAVEIATLKPLFPGSNEVDQVWRVCEIMGSPGTWVTKEGERIGGGKWSEGVKLAQKLGFSFPRMMPHGMDTILPAPQWPPSLRSFVTQCLLWDPKARPTTAECLQHEYFQDAHDPLRPKSSSRLIGRKRSDLGHPRPNNQSIDSTQSLTSKGASWIRKSLVARESAPAVPQHFPEPHTISPRMTPTEQAAAPAPVQEQIVRPVPVKRNTWANAPSNGAPMQLLPSIGPVAPLTMNVNAQRHAAAQPERAEANPTPKIGRHLSMASSGNHYAELHRQEAERTLNGQTTPASPPSSHKDPLFSWSHLRKRARRLSGRRPSPGPNNQDDIEANAGCAPWASNRNSGMVDSMFDQDPTQNPDFGELDRALNNVRYSIDATVNAPLPPQPVKQAPRAVSNPNLKRHHSLPPVPKQQTAGRMSPSNSMRRLRRGGQKSGLLSGNFEAPDEQEELLDEALAGAQAAIARMDQQAQRERQMREAPAMKLDLGFLNGDRRAKSDAVLNGPVNVPYPTPSPSKNHRGFFLDSSKLHTQPIPIEKLQQRYTGGQNFPTPPDEEDWGLSVLAAGEQWR